MAPLRDELYEQKRGVAGDVSISTCELPEPFCHRNLGGLFLYGPEVSIRKKTEITK